MDVFNEGGGSSDDDDETSPESLLSRIEVLEGAVFSAEEKKKILDMLTEYMHTIYARRILTRLGDVEDALRKAGLLK